MFSGFQHNALWGQPKLRPPMDSSPSIQKYSSYCGARLRVRYHCQIGPDWRIMYIEVYIAYTKEALSPASPSRALAGCFKSQRGCLKSSGPGVMYSCGFLTTGPHGLCLVKWPLLPVHPLLSLEPQIGCLGVNMIHGSAWEVLSDGPHYPWDGNQIPQALFQQPPPPQETRDSRLLYFYTEFSVN